MTASSALQLSHVFPASSVRQAHLGYLLGWLQGGRTRDSRLAAARLAEKQSAATVLDPQFEREKVQPLVDEWGEANRKKNLKGCLSAEASVKKILTPELLRRWDLTCDSIQTLRSDKRSSNPGLSNLVAFSKKDFNREWGEKALNEDAGDEPFWPNPFTDYNTRIAAGGYHQRVADDQKARYFLVHGDRELQREELASGHGLIGVITAVNSSEPEWTIKFSYPDLSTIKDGDYIVIAGAHEMKLTVTEIDHEKKIVVAEPGWKNAKPQFGQKGLPSRDRAWKGQKLVFLEDQPFSLAERLAFSSRSRWPWPPRRAAPARRAHRAPA